MDAKDVKETLREAKDKVAATVGSTVEKNSDKIETGIDKAAGFVDEMTKGKYHERIESVTGLAKDKLGLETSGDDVAEGPASSEGTPPTPPTPPAEPTDPPAGSTS